MPIFMPFALLAGLLAGQAPAQSDVVPRTALVTVVARPNGPVDSLAPADVTVREDGATRDVLEVKRATEPLFITLLIDTTRPPVHLATTPPDLRRGLLAFVSAIKKGNPDAEISILDYAGAPVTVLDFTSEKPRLERYIDRLYPNRMADGVVIDGLVEAAVKLGDKPSPRRAIVIIDFNWRDASSVPAMQQAGDIVHRSGATVWTVSVRGTTSASSSSHREHVLEGVTRASGGSRMTIVEASGLEAVLKGVANSLLSQYTVTFARPANARVESTEMESRRGKVLLTPWMR